MKKKLAFLAIAVCAIGLAAVFFFPTLILEAQKEIGFEENDPDMPSYLANSKDPDAMQEFLAKRAEYFGMRRGITSERMPDPHLRQQAITKMEEQEAERLNRPVAGLDNRILAAWTAIGPNPIPNGSFPWSGRTISIAVNPTNPNIVYVGAAQGGLYRSLDGGTTWTPIMDGAMSLAIGAIAICPSQPETLYIGTGEHNFSSDSFFGVGVYRINNASTTATVTGPFNKDASMTDVFTGRGISRIMVHPTDPATIFVATTSGVGGIGGQANNVLPSRGVYRSTNATSGAPTFDRMTGLAGNTNASVRDIVIDPSNANILLAGVVANGGGIYRSANALANPASSATFTQIETFSSSSTSELTTEFAAIHPGGDTDATIYAATGNLGGRVLKSTNGGASFVQQIDNNFCTPQCFYNIAVAVAPNDPTRVYLGGAPSLPFGFSTNSGTSFTNSSSGLHVDSHVIAVAPSDPTVIYFGSDGGIYKSVNSGSTWASLNNSQYFATQFESVAVHPTDPKFSIGGTQDNGTNYYDTSGSWARVDGGDGGYTLIDQNATDTTNVRMYHTYFNQLNNVVGYATRATTAASWTFRGCNGTTPANGINCADTSILFYAPLEQGPGSPNTVYYGTDRLYRSPDAGVTHTVVSQAPITSGVPLSAIGISPQNDNVRIVGQQTGGLWGTTTGSSTLIDLDPTNVVPNAFIARAVIDPNNVNTAYVTIAAFGVTNVYKTTNFNATPPTWTAAAGSGGTALPQVPVSGFVVDPLNSSTLFAGTDIGVYVSTDAGASWAPFGTGLPRVAVFDMAITGSTPRFLRIATHGRGMYDISLSATPRSPYDFDGDGKSDISIFRPAVGEWWYLKSSNGGNAAFQFGNAADKIAPGDYTGDGKADVAFWRPTTGEWFILRSENGSYYSFPFGSTGDIPVPADYDGDGKTDTAVFRPTNNTWYILNSHDLSVTFTTFGTTGDKPTPADYDGDGKADVAIYRPGPGEWWYLRSTDGGNRAFQFGNSADKPVQGDYTGDGKADIAFWRPSTGEWFILRSENGSYFSFPFGLSADLPAPGDYDGDGKIDATIFRPSTNFWFSNTATQGVIITPFGTTGDKPVPGAYVP